MKNSIIVSLSLFILVLFFNLVEKSQQLTSLSNRYDKVLVTTYYKERLLEDEISKLNIELNGKNFELDMAINRVEQLNLELGKQEEFYVINRI